MTAAAQRLTLLRIGFALVAVGLVASVFVLLTMQAAYSPFALALPSGPFEQLASESFRFAGAAFLFVALAAGLGLEADLRGLTRLYTLGAFSKLGLLAFAAANGMMAIQATDPRTLAPKLFAARILTNALVVVSLVWAGRLLSRPRTPSAPGSSA